MTDISFEDVMDSIGDGTDLPIEVQPETEVEERVTPEETPEDGSNPVGEPESETKEEEKVPPEEASPEEKPAEEKEEKPDEKSDEKEGEELETPEPTFKIGDEEVTLSQIQTWRKEAERVPLLQKDHTQKTQAASDANRKALEMQESNATLAGEISNDPGLQKLLAARPESLQYLMKDPVGTRSMMGNPKAVEEFWGAMDAINDNPLLAEKFNEAAEPSEAEALLKEQQQADNVNAIVGTLDMTIDAAAKEFFPDVDPNEVKAYVAGMAGMPEEPTHDDWVAGADRLYHLFFKTVDGKAELAPHLLEVEFARLQAIGKDKASEEAPPEDEVSQHNAQVDKQLNDDEPPPKTPDGKPPVAEPEKPVQYKDFQEALNDI